MADAGSPGEFTQRKLKALRFAQDFKRGSDDGAAQIAVVVWTFLDIDGSRVSCLGRSEEWFHDWVHRFPCEGLQFNLDAFVEPNAILQLQPSS
jgi:hypothetical protein